MAVLFRGAATLARGGGSLQRAACFPRGFHGLRGLIRARRAGHCRGHRMDCLAILQGFDVTSIRPSLLTVMDVAPAGSGDWVSFPPGQRTWMAVAGCGRPSTRMALSCDQ